MNEQEEIDAKELAAKALILAAKAVKLAGQKVTNDQVIMDSLDRLDALLDRAQATLDKNKMDDEKEGR